MVNIYMGYKPEYMSDMKQYLIYDSCHNCYRCQMPAICYILDVTTRFT